MSRRDLIDPESRLSLDTFLEALPGGFNAIPDMRATGERPLTALLAALEVPAEPARGHPGGPHGPRRPMAPASSPFRVSAPWTPSSGLVLPCLYWIHGGGMMIGQRRDRSRRRGPVRVCGVHAVVSVITALRRSTRYPARWRTATPGCSGRPRTRLTLGWMRAGAPSGARRRRRAGGGVALMARDHGGPALASGCSSRRCWTTETTLSSQEITDLGVWDRAGNIEAGGAPRRAGGRPVRRARPGRRPHGAAAFIDVGTLDLFHDEDIEFAQRLMRAGVPVELHVYPGAFHATELVAPQSVLSQRIWAMRIDALRRALA